MEEMKIVTPRSSSPDDSDIVEAAEHLAAGGIVAHPTETLYGLAVDPWNDEALSRLARLKGRREGAAFILISASAADANRLVKDPAARHYATLAAAFWPGALTMVVLASARAPSGARGPGGGIALRVTPEPLAAALVNRFGHPVTSTSANVAGGAPAESAGRIAEIFPVGVAIVIDGGLRPAGLPSTLIDLTADRPRILREGAVDRAAIEAALGEGAP